MTARSGLYVTQRQASACAANCKDERTAQMKPAQRRTGAKPKRRSEMKRMEGPEFDPYRVPMSEMQLMLSPGVKPDHKHGAFVLPVHTASQHWRAQNPDRADQPYVYLRVIASSGGGWDHVSVSAENPDKTIRVPRWGEMEYVKRRFFADTETAMQLHVPVSLHININPNVLHIWRPHNWKIRLPPKSMV